jgi:hypothetical protein
VNVFHIHLFVLLNSIGVGNEIILSVLDHQKFLEKCNTVCNLKSTPHVL